MILMMMELWEEDFFILWMKGGMRKDDREEEQEWVDNENIGRNFYILSKGRCA
jgi:hypothetical protein